MNINLSELQTEESVGKLISENKERVTFIPYLQKALKETLEKNIRFGFLDSFEKNISKMTITGQQHITDGENDVYSPEKRNALIINVGERMVHLADYFAVSIIVPQKDYLYHLNESELENS